MRNECMRPLTHITFSPSPPFSPHLFTFLFFSSFSLFFPDNCFVRSLRRVADGRDGPPLHAILPRARDGGARVEPGRGSIIRRLRSAGCKHRAAAVQAACGARRTTITAETRICFVARPECPAGLSGWMQLHIITVRTVQGPVRTCIALSLCNYIAPGY